MHTRTTPRPAGLRAAVGLTGLALACAYTLAAPGIAGADTPLPDACTADGDTITCTYSYTGTEQVFTVPDGVTSIAVTAVGGHGGDSGKGAAGGQGAQVSGPVDTTGIDTLYVEVGGIGGIGGIGDDGNQPSSTPGGWNGGGTGGWQSGGGGGATDIRTVSMAGTATATESLQSRLLVAGAGGGASYVSPGGDAGHAGGGDPAQAGLPGTATAGGDAPFGQDGALGVGGDAMHSTSASGGGAGLYGGGSGGPHGGAGGGSSLVPDGGSGPTLTTAAPSVTIVYTTPEPECTGSLCMLFGSLTSSLTGVGT